MLAARFWMSGGDCILHYENYSCRFLWVLMRIATARATLGSDPRSQKTSNKKIQIGNKTLYQETQKISDTPSICRCQGMDKPVSA